MEDIKQLFIIALNAKKEDRVVAWTNYHEAIKNKNILIIVK